MTKILRLETKGFKSFAEKTTIQYGDGFNVILGPNGSGKSNVLDSLCFVLGKSGAKGLRAEKSANLIYNGGKSKTPAKEGMVAIYLDNSDGVFPVKGKEVCISRTVKQNGSSVYKINDDKCTRDQVLELLSHADIDPNGYNIILQGDIVRLVEMSALERRGIIEEIAGISVYEDKKSKAMKELDKIENNLNEAEIILAERKSYLKELKKERDQAVTYRELTETVKSLKASIVKADIDKRNNQIEDIKKKSNVYTTKIEAAQKEIDELKANVKSYKEEVAKINKEIEEKGEKNQVALHKEVEQLKVDLATHNANISGLKNELDRVKGQKDQLTQSLKELNEKASAAEKDSKANVKALADNNKLQTDIEKKISDFKKKNNLDGASDVDKKIQELDEKAEVLEKEIFEVRGKQQDFIREKDRLEVQITNADERIEKVMKVSNTNKQDLVRLKEMKENFKKSTRELQECLTADASYASQVSTARGKLASLQEELAKFRVRQASLSAMIGGNLAVKSILDNKDKFDGVYGTVAELGSVDKKYSAALDMAAGSRLNSIVVRDDRVASECIKFLKSERKGSATFLPLNKIKGPSAVDVKGNGVIGSAIKLVKFDPKFKVVFQYVFGGTVVVDSIDVARRLGIGKYKMVSLDGDMAELSGAMKGGFRQKRPGSGFQENKGDDESKVEQEVADYQSMVSRLESERRQNQDKIDRLRELKANLEGDIIKIEKSLHLDDDDLNISKKLKKEFEARLSEVDKELMTINSNVSTKNRELATYKIEKQKLRSQIMDMRNPTKLAELNTFEEKLTSLKNEAIRLETSLEGMKNQSESSEKNNINALIKTNDDEMAEIKSKIEDLKEKVVSVKTDLKVKEAAEKEFMAKFKKFFAERNKLLEKVDKEESKIIKKEEDVREIEHKNTTYSLDLARIKAELNAFEEDFKQYEGVNLVKVGEDTRKELWSAEQKLSRIGNVNMKALEIFEKIEEEFNKLVEKKDVLVSEREKILVMINEIESKKKELFLKVFKVVNDNFQKVFKILSTKGDASMVLENPKSPFDGGVLIKVRLKGKKYMDVRSLSGGEKTLTALAFIFAVQEHNPASFYIFDEVDAALDKRNSEKLASLIKSYSSRAQYVVISHNDGVINSADNLYGVSMNEHGITKVVSLKI